MFVPVGNQKHKIIITFLISIPLIYSQMLVQLFINDGHFGYITKLAEWTLNDGIVHAMI